MVTTSVSAEKLCSSPNKYSCTKAGKGKRRGALGREKEGGREGGRLILATTYAALTSETHSHTHS